jgi:hypothetical protein
MGDIKRNVRKSLVEHRKTFRRVFHGTDSNAASDIKKNGVGIEKGHGGYFGWGFYTTPDIELAKSNYADFSDNENDGIILEFEILAEANILDLDDPEDFETWKPFSDKINYKDLYKKLTKKGIDGLWDESFEGVVIYNPKVLKLIKIH